MTGNVLVVTAINFDPKLNTITNMLIMNLAFTDICMASLHMPFWVISLRYGRWVFNHVLCQLVGLTQLTFGITSLFTMTGIAFNRYFNVVRRNLYTKYFSTKKVTYFVIAAAWLGALAVTSPQLYGWGKIAYHPLFAVCTCIWDLPDVSFMVFLCAGTFFHHRERHFVVLLHHLQNRQSQCREDAGACSRMESRKKERRGWQKREDRKKGSQDFVCGSLCFLNMLDPTLSSRLHRDFWIVHSTVGTFIFLLLRLW